MISAIVIIGEWVAFVAVCLVMAAVASWCAGLMDRIDGVLYDEDPR